ncbi:hypothetical protein D9Y22_20405 [Methylorubrum sp. DB1722]|nr:hypothetical protein [Methylorubrum sp. DB1722]
MPIDDALQLVRQDVSALLAVPPVLLGAAKPPNTNGVYMLLVGETVKYVGEAKGSKGLKDRLLSKHISGDDSHAIQRAFSTEFPDRTLRRDHIKQTVSARWIAIEDDSRISAVEQVLIWLYDPEWNERERRFRQKTS